mgnify:CR=1 FL=1
MKRVVLIVIGVVVGLCGLLGVANGAAPDANTVAVTALPTAIADQNNPEKSAKEKAGKIAEAVDISLCHK